MLEFFDPHPDVNVQESEYRRLLGYPNQHELAERSRELADWARQWYAENARPWVYAREAGRLEIANDELRVNGAGFTSKRFHDQLIDAEAHQVVLVAVSAGKECEEKARELWKEGKPDEYFFLEILGSAVVEHLITTTGARICAWAEQNGMTVLPHYSPGYSGWDVTEQPGLWSLIRQNNGSVFSGELQVMETGMLQPKKSLLAVFGITRRLDKVRSLAGLIPCQNCSFSPCQYRRAAYRNPLPQIEDVRRYQSRARENVSDGISGTSGLNHNAKYSIKPKALQKWSTERLQLKTLPDGSVQAHFCYEGTTCSDLGRPLEYHYQVKLGPAELGHRIVEMNCAPAPDDTGHTAQCEYLNNAKIFRRSVAEEKPLLGRPLNDVLTWNRPFDPSGCFCDAHRRTHKWGLVLEVIHYALVQREKELAERQPVTTLK
ncbi:MAG TPA: hypothetical protein VKA67_02990 [Verrucomicrobiae bacterium]|nr:hypothetical protein [Verrucomicrobiae bacterium]